MENLLIHRAFAQSDTTVEGLVNAIVTGLLNPLITLLFVLATAVFLWGVATYVIGSRAAGTRRNSPRPKE
jgi:phage shock protein PspC (stress-responsive transcriptional regulator)